MTSLKHARVITNALCLSAAVAALAGDVVLNPQRYGEVVSWTASTVITGLVVGVWLGGIALILALERSRNR